MTFYTTCVCEDELTSFTMWPGLNLDLGSGMWTCHILQYYFNGILLITGVEGGTSFALLQQCANGVVLRWEQLFFLKVRYLLYSSHSGET